MFASMMQIRNEAIKRSSNLVFSICTQNKNKELTRKEVRQIAFKESLSTIKQLSLLIPEENRLSEAAQELLAHKVTLVAMNNFF